MRTRIVITALFLLLAAPGVAATPPLTTIQDVLYKADGTRFAGLLTIKWVSFEAFDTSNIATQSVTVQISAGNLRVQLVPTTTATPTAYYSVQYNSAGKVQFNEWWSVPASSTPLRVRDVRLPGDPLSTLTTAGSAGTGGGTATTVAESDVVGLAADLSARPVKSPGYTGGRSVFANAAGALESVTGNASDCVRVDGSAGPCGYLQALFTDNDTPVGIVDGSNTVFMLAAAPSPAHSLLLYRNGILLKAGFDYTLGGNVVTFIPAMTPQPGDTLLASYRLTGDTSAGSAFPTAQVLCGGVGATTNTALSQSLGVCTIGADLLTAGSRIEVRYNLEHKGAASGFHMEVHWGGTTAASVDAAAGETLLGGSLNAGLDGTAAQITAQRWGVVTPFSTSILAAPDALSNGVAVEFFGRLNTAGADTLALKSFSVVRLP